MNRLRKDTQKPELDDLRLEVSYMPLQTHPSFGGMSGEKHEDELAKANVDLLVRKLISARVIVMCWQPAETKWAITRNVAMFAIEVLTTTTQT